MSTYSGFVFFAVSSLLTLGACHGPQGAPPVADSVDPSEAWFDEGDVPDGWAMSLVSWDHSDLSWCIADPGELSNAMLSGGMEAATQAWAEAEGSPWTFYETACEDADFSVFVQAVDGRGEIAAYAGVEDAVLIVLDEAEDWVDELRADGGQPVDVRTAMLHEVGHVIGLGHVDTFSADPESVMQSSYVGSRRTLTADDIALMGVSSAGPVASLTVEVWVWEGEQETGVDGCPASDDEPCVDYRLAEVLSIGESASVEQFRGWPVQLRYEAVEGVTVPVLGLEGGAASGVATFNPTSDLEIEFCAFGSCATTLSLTIRAPEVSSSSSCVDVPLTGMTTTAPGWWESNGEAYGVGNHADPACTHPDCDADVPWPVCTETGEPNMALEACQRNGCQCGVGAAGGAGWAMDEDDGSLRYDAAAQRDVRAPWFVDRWETGGVYVHRADDVVVSLGAEVNLSGEGMVYRPVVDIRAGWDGSWARVMDDTLRSDGVEGPPVFDNAINRYLAGEDGFIPVTLTFRPSSYATEFWLQPILNLMVLDESEAEGAQLRNLRFEVCGDEVYLASCDASWGCVPVEDASLDRDSDGIVDARDLIHASAATLCLDRSAFPSTDAGPFAVVGDYQGTGSWAWNTSRLAAETGDEVCYRFPAGDYRVTFLSESGTWAEYGDFCWSEADTFCANDGRGSFALAFTSDGSTLAPTLGDE